jgi:hypothetical protein
MERRIPRVWGSGISSRATMCGPSGAKVLKETVEEKKL